MTFYEKFIDECAKIGMAPSAAMEDMGLNRSTLTGWKKRNSVPSDFVMGVVANYFGCPLEDLASARAETLALRSPEERKRKRPTVFDNLKVPLLGAISCGAPILAYENIDEMIPVPPKVHADFALRCKGDSMINARIFDGDIVYIKKQPTVDNGQIAAVLIGDEATLKRIYLYDDHITLMPENPSFQPIHLFGDEAEQVMILGKAVASMTYL